MCNVTRDFQTVRPHPFANCHIFSDSFLPWGVKYYMHGRKVFTINQSIKIYIAPLQDTYSEASRPRPSGKEQSLECGGIENRHRLEGALDLLEGSPFQVFGPTTENERVCIVAEPANGTTKLP